MTSTQNNDRKRKAKAEPIDIDAAMAKLILLRREHGLPRPIDYNGYYGDENNPTHTITVSLATHADAIAWADALKIDAVSRRSHLYDDGSEIHGSHTKWHGWHLNIRASIKPADTRHAAVLDDTTVAGLEEVAAGPKPLVSDATIAEVEQVSRLVAPVDLLLPTAPCGCPIKGVGVLRYVDHCEACTEAVSA